jgi:hypothetical protein
MITPTELLKNALHFVEQEIIKAGGQPATKSDHAVMINRRFGKRSSR